MFTGPFQCRLPATEQAASFHPNGMVRDTDSLRGRWTHRARTLTIERSDGPDLSYPYEPFVLRGTWVLATPSGAVPCRLGHDAEVPSSGAWLTVRSAGGDLEAAGRRLHDLAGVGLVTEGAAVSEATGLRLVHAAGHESLARTVGQQIADRLGREVTLHVAEDAGHLELQVGR